MRKVLIWILPLFALAWSCAKDDAGTAERAKARLTLNILEEGPRLAARAADEKAVQDVNVFLYDVRGIARPQHFYVQGGVLACSVPVGEYEVYAVANLHEDMGAMDRGALLAYEFRMPRNYASLPMSGRAACTVGPKTQSITVSVRRNVAKIVCNISFYGTNYNLKLQSVQMMDMAGVTTLFAEDLPTTPTKIPASMKMRIIVIIFGSLMPVPITASLSLSCRARFCRQATSRAIKNMTTTGIL